MKKKTTLITIVLSLITSVFLHAAQAPTQPFVYESQEIFHQITSEGLKISLTPEGAPTQLLNIMAFPIGEDDEDMTVKTLMKAAHKSGRPFCFILCIKKDASSPTILLADENLHSLTNLPEGTTPVGKYKLYTGGKGSCFPPDFIIQPAPPTVFIQHVPIPAPYPVAVHIPVREPYPAPYPVFFETVRTQVVTIPCKDASEATNEPAPTEHPTYPSSPTPHDTASATLQAQEMLQDKRDAELKVIAAQKAQEAARLKKIKETADLQAMKNTQEQARKMLEQQQKEQRAQQAQRDRDTAAQQKTVQEAAKQQELAQQAAAKKVAKEKAKKMATASVTTPKASASGKKKSNAAKAANDDDDDGFEKLMAQAAAFNAKLPPHQAAPASQKKRLGFGSDEASPAQGYDLPEFEAQSEGALLVPVAMNIFTPKSQADQEASMIKEINDAMESQLYVMAKELLKKITPNTPHYFVFLTNIYLNASRLLNHEEIENLMTNALKLAKDKRVDRWNRCIFYFGLALHADTYEEKETYSDLCLSCGEHVRARTYWERIQLERHDALATAPCPKGKSCPHLRTLTFVTDQQSEQRGKSVIFSDAVVMFLKLYLGPCPQIRALAPNRVLYIKNIYDKTVRLARYTQAELDEIHSLIPEDIIPLDQRVQPVE